MAEKGQVSIIYMVITIGIAFVIAAGVFLFARGFQSNVSENLNDIGLGNVAVQLENAFLDLKFVADNTNESSINLTVQIPKQIGEQRYSVAADGTNTLELRTRGSPSDFRLLELRFWQNATVKGFVDSSQGFVQLNLYNQTSILLL